MSARNISTACSCFSNFAVDGIGRGCDFDGSNLVKDSLNFKALNFELKK